MKLIMENWRAWVKENQAESLINDNLFLVENQQVVGHKNFDVLCEELDSSLITEEEFIDTWTRSVLYEWSLIEEGVDLSQIQKWGADKWAQLKSSAMVKAAQVALNLIDKVVKVLTRAFDHYSAKLYLAVFGVIRTLIKTAAKLKRFLGPAFLVLAAALILIAATAAIASAAASPDPSAVEVSQEILNQAIDLLTTDLYSNLGGAEGIEDEVVKVYTGAMEQGGEIVQVTDELIWDRSMKESNVVVRSIEQLLNSKWMDATDADTVKLSFDQMLPEVAEKVREAVEVAQDVQGLDPALAEAQAEAGSKVELVGKHFVESMTKVVTDTSTGASDELTDIVTTTGKDIPVRR